MSILTRIMTGIKAPSLKVPKSPKISVKMTSTKLPSLNSVKLPKEKKMSDFNIQNFLGAKSTSQSQAEGRLKAGVSNPKKIVIKTAIKRIKLPKK